MKQPAVAGRTELDLHERSVPQPWVPQPEMGVHQCWCALGAEVWG